MTKKKGLLLTVCLLASTLTGCTNENLSENDKITIWAYDTTADVAQSAVDIYKRNHPDCNREFEVVNFGQEEMVEKIKTMLATGTKDSLPDLFYDEDYNFSEYLSYSTDNFYDMSDFLSNESFYDYKKINVTMDNKMYAVPYDAGTAVMFYRLDLITAAGYSENDMKKLTWDEYIEIGKKVEEKTGIDMVVMCPDGDMEGRILYQSAGTWFFDENGKPNMTDPAFKDAFSTIKLAYDSGIVYNANSWDDYINAIANEKICCLIGASWWAPIMSEYTEQSGLWRVTEMPRMTQNDHYTNYSNLGGGNWYVINNENSSFVAEFATEMFAQSQELADAMADKYFFIPVNEKIAENLSTVENEFFGGQDIAKLLNEYNKHILPVKYGLNSYEMTYTVGPFVGKFVNEEMSIAEVVEQSQSVAVGLCNE